MDFKIESDVDMPEAWSKYPFGGMEVGQSFAIDAGSVVLVRNAASAHGRKHGKKFSVRKVDGVGRVWRIE